MLFVRGEEMGNYRNKVLSLLIGFFLFFGFSEFGMAAAAKPIKLCYSTTGKGSGTVAFSTGTVKNKCATYAAGTSTTITLTANPNTGSSFGSWSGCTSPSSNVCTVTLTATTAVKVTFDKNPKLTVVSDTTKGTVSSSSLSCLAAKTCTQSFASGTVIDLSAVAKDTYSFTGWTGGCVSKESTCSIILTKDVKLTAGFSTPKATGKTIGTQVGVSPAN
jgi:uncharacterized repeat protein (TIGR02543 family)